MEKQIKRLVELLAVEELETLISAIETIKNTTEGYGTIQIEIRNRWVTKAYPTPSIKTKPKTFS